jgi:TonB-linked SusC/RagA family outer membrane protein
MIKTLFLFIFIGCANFVFAQAIAVTGQVTDDDNFGLPGVTIVEVGTTNGTITDIDGNFTIEVPVGAQLQFSFIGYATTVQTVGTESVMNIVLATDSEVLDEVVVTGYTAQSKRSITGAVTSVDAEQLQEIPATTFAQQLQGRAAGVTITNDATPGGAATVRIRGFGTVGNNDPLYIIDGVPSTNQNTLNPNDIETLQVLKDASAASIYGSRAANGVIIITTKKGKLGAPKLSYNAFYGVQNKANDVDALDAEGLGRYLYLADLYAGKTPSHGQYDFSGGVDNIRIPKYVFPSGADTADESTYALEPGNINAITRSADTDWWEEVTRSNAPIVNHQLSATGATESARYALSVNYFSQDGITEFVGYERASVRANTEFKTLGGRLTVGENLSVTLGTRKGGFGNNQEQNAVSGSYKHHPLLPVYDVADNFAGARGANLGNNFNPYAQLFRNQDDRNINLRAFGNVFADVAILNNLKFRSSLGIDLNTNRTKDIGRPQPEYVEGNFINSSNQSHGYSYQWVFSNTLNYNKTFGTVHNFNANIGIEAINEFGEFFGASRQRFAFETTDIISYLDLGDATTSNNFGNVSSDYSLFSQFGQFNYAYDDRYLVQVTIRNDASSRFLQASNSAVFPAFSLGWRVSEESFFDGIDFIDDLKIRYGWGQTGNQLIGDYNAFTTYRSNIFNASYPIDGNDGSPTLGFDASAFGNPDAKWETTTSNNLGFDARMFKNRLSVEFDLWNRVTTDMLLQVPIVFSAGDARAPAFNVGQVSNRGLDIGLSYSDAIGDFYYSIGGNLSTYRNQIDALDSDDSRIFGNSSRVPSMTVTEVGSPISSFFGFEVEGIFQNQAEVESWPAYGDYNSPGKFKIRDVNGDNVINDDDRTIIGNPHPDFTYGLNLNLGYKDFELSLFGNGSQGNDIFNYVRFFADFNTFQGNRSTRALEEAWQPSNPTAPKSQWTAANPDATTPIMDANDQISSRVSTYLIEDGSFFRMKNIQLTYNLPNGLFSDYGFGGGQIYIQGQNMLTFTQYSGLNPEIQTGNDTTLGFDGGFMPVARTVIFGLNINL